MTRQEKKRDKQIKLIEYLKQVNLTKRSVVKVKDISEYGRENILWISEVLRIPDSNVRDWENANDELILKLDHKHEPICPDVPEICRPWVDESRLFDTGSTQILRNSITEEVDTGENEDQTEIKIRQIYLSDHPEVSAAWQKYLENKWQP